MVRKDQSSRSEEVFANDVCYILYSLIITVLTFDFVHHHERT